MISFLNRKQVDESKWAACVQYGLIYSSLIYLDVMCDRQWDALILNDYEAVMPLPWRKKYGIKYVYQPPFMQQLGISAASVVKAGIVSHFMRAMKEHVKFAEYPFNSKNLFTEPLGKHTLKENFYVPLAKLAEVSSQVDDSFNKSLRRLQKWDFQYKMEQDPTTIFNLYRELYLPRIDALSEDDLQRFLMLCTRLNNTNQLVLRTVCMGAENLAMVLLLKDDSRLYNIMACLTPNGKTLEANYFLYYNILNEFKGQDLMLDLEGSSIPGVARFYKKLNPLTEYYAAIKFNNLPAWVKLFKR